MRVRRTFRLTFAPGFGTLIVELHGSIPCPADGRQARSSKSNRTHSDADNCVCRVTPCNSHPPEIHRGLHSNGLKKSVEVGCRWLCQTAATTRLNQANVPPVIHMG
jgi:hypothetical protein